MRPAKSSRTIALLFAGGITLAVSGPVRAQGSPGTVVPPATQSASTLPAPAAFDPVTATKAYLATVPAEKRARSDAYFEGGYWLQLWDFLLGAFVAWLLLSRRWSARMRDRAERISRFRPIQTFLTFVQYLLVSSALLFPMTVYEGFFREHQYGLATQGFGAWFGDQLKGLAVGLIFGGIAVTALYGVLRRAPKTWWLWGAITALAFSVLGSMIAPVYVAPLFNKYTRLTDPLVRDPILSLARAQGVAAHDVWVYDASRQTTRVSANVSGFAGTERISLNDNLLNRCTLAEIEAVMAHEIGHYVLNHVYKGTLFFGVEIVNCFAFLRLAWGWATARKGHAWNIRGVGDVAGLPLFVFLLSVFFFVMTPVNNTFIRVQEAEADLFGVNASGQPDGEAEVDLKLGEYRKLDPGPVEEALFFDHPSGRNRILMAMRWKAEHMEEAERNARRAAEVDARRPPLKGAVTAPGKP